MPKCELCDRHFQDYTSLGSHIGQSHRNIRLKDYYDKYYKIDPNEGICKNPECGKHTKFEFLTTGYIDHCSRSCATKMLKIKPKIKKEIDLNCKICKHICGSSQSLSRHIKKEHKEICIQNYYDKYIKTDLNEGLCKKCGKETKFLNIVNGYSQYCPYEYSVKEKKNDDHKKIICQICGNKYETYKALGIHIVQFHGKGEIKSKQDYYDKYLKTEPNNGICKTCGKKTRFINLIYGYNDHCNTSCSKLDPEVNEKTIQTSLERYGVTNYSKTEEARKKTSEWMTEWGCSYITSFITSPSKPQVELYNMIKELFPNSEIEHWVDEVKRRIDIAIPNLKIAVEYDGSYWHQNNESDLIRQKELEDLGWKFIRYMDRLPNKQEFIKDVNSIL